MQLPNRTLLRASGLVLAALASLACSEQDGTVAGHTAVEPTGSAPGAGQGRAFQGTLPSGSTWDDIGPAELAQSQAGYAWLSSVATATEIAPLIAAGVGGTILNYSVFVEATGGIELFSLFVPDTDPSVPRPLLTAFHGAGSSHGDIYFRAMDFFVEADQRDWFLIAPLQRNLNGPADTSYASAESQLHVEVLIQLILDTYSIDRDRLYAAGFSMGGGNALSYAARHRDRRSGAISAVVNHTGSVALSNVYVNAPTIVVDIMEGIFGGPPTGPVFEWQRSSLIEVDAAGSLLSQGRHMALNLEHVPVQTWFNSLDNFTYLQAQAQTLHGFISALPAGDHELVTVPGGVPNCVGQHCWDTLDIAAACQWLSAQSLEANPAAGTVLADRDARWGRFDVAQRLQGAFTEFEYTVNPSANLLAITDTGNALSVSVRVQKLGLDPSQPLFVSTTRMENQGNAIVLRGYTAAPTTVTRNGIFLGPTCGDPPATVGWCYDAQAGTVTIDESSNLSATWRIQ